MSADNKQRKCKRCKTIYCPNYYTDCPFCASISIDINVSVNINANNIKEFYKLN